MASFDPNAASQINVDPALKPKTPKELAVRRQQLIEMFMNKGFDQPTAEREADRYLADFPVATGQQVAGPAAPAPAAPMSPQESMEADLYGKGYSADEARTQARIQAELRAEREAKQLERDLSQGGYGQRRVPGPRDLSGNAPMGAPFASVKEGQDYTARSVDEDGLTQESQKDKAMRARGYAPVIGPDGSVSYMVGYNPGFIGGPGRPGARPDLAGKYEVIERTGINDKREMVYAPTDSFRQQMAEQDARIKAARDKRNPYKDLPSPAERMKRFQAQIQLGGGRLTPQAIAMESLLNGMDPERQAQARQFMLPGADNAAKVQVAEAEAGPRNAEADARIQALEARMEEARADREQRERQFAEKMAMDKAAMEARAAADAAASQERLAAMQSQSTNTLAQIQAAIQNSQNEWATRDKISEREQSTLQGKLDAVQADAARGQALAESARREAEAVALAGPGGVDIARGQYETPAAQASFKKLAAKADQTWNGFFTEDAARLDAMLVRIGVTDPAKRRELVQKYGIDSDFPGYQGRGSVLSSWRVRHPEYAPVTPAQ